jgi:hemoglobin
MATEDSLSLYERLGGVYSIATVVDDFIDRIMIDPRLNSNPLRRRGPSSRSPRRL